MAKYQYRPIFTLLTDIGLSANEISCRVADTELPMWPSESEKFLLARWLPDGTFRKYFTYPSSEEGP